MTKIEKKSKDTTTLNKYKYDEFCKIFKVHATFETDEERKWAYNNRDNLAYINIEDLYEMSPFMEYTNNINIPLHIRFASIKKKT
jgi:hypothetical protein